MLFLVDCIVGNYDTGFGNGIPGSCSIDYFFRNHNVGSFDSKIQNDPEIIFKNHGLERYASRFVPKIKQLAEEYATKVSKYGTFYLIGIPKKHVHESIASVRTGGFIRPSTVNGKDTTDMQEIITALMSEEYIQPTNAREYILTMTADEHGGNNPQDKVVIPFMIPKSKEIYDAWCEEWCQALGELAEEIKKDRVQNVTGKNISEDREFLGTTNSTINTFQAMLRNCLPQPIYENEEPENNNHGNNGPKP